MMKRGHCSTFSVLIEGKIINQRAVYIVFEVGLLPFHQYHIVIINMIITHAYSRHIVFH